MAVKIKVTFGTNPPQLMLTTNRPQSEPLIIYDGDDALRLVLDLIDAYKKAWPDKPKGEVINE